MGLLMESPARNRLDLALSTVALTASCLVLAGYVVAALSLIGYPWDWSPDEGLYLDYARRLLESPASLHARSFVPFPSAYGPGLPALLAPALATRQPLLAARCLMLAAVLVATWAVYALARRHTSRSLALAAAALSLAPFDLTFWHMLVRPDGPMTTLWLLAAMALLPSRLERGADTLSVHRTAVGIALLLASVLTKQTAALYGAPLVLGWWLVDRRSAARLTVALALCGALMLAGLQGATAGGYLWVNQVWAFHDWQASQAWLIAREFTGRCWPVLLAAAFPLALAARRGSPAQARADGSLLLLAGALVAAPLTAKFGAWWNYVLPLLPAAAVASARVSASLLVPTRRPRGQVAAAAMMASLALALALHGRFPLPNSADEATARSLYSYIDRFVRENGGPLLAIRPELAYVIARQDVEMEGSGYLHLARNRAPGAELVTRRLGQATYTLVVMSWPMPDDAIAELKRSYTFAGACRVGYYYGQTPVALFTRDDRFTPLEPLRGARCGRTGS